MDGRPKARRNRNERRVGALADRVQRARPVAGSPLGTGELIADAIARGAEDFRIGLGGSATNDAGVGMGHRARMEVS